MNTAATSAVRRPTRPIARAVNKNKIPRALRLRNAWVNWRYVLKRMRDGAWKWTKVPMLPNGSYANHASPQTWSKFEQVLPAYERGGFDGIGFVTAGADIDKRLRDPFVLIDLDHVRDPATNAVEPWAAEIISAAHRERAYLELSPSGTGFHVIGQGPQGFRGRKANGVEMYCSLRFFTITGGLAFNPSQRVLGTLNRTIELVTARLGIPKATDPEEPKAPAIAGRRPYVSSWTDDDILALAFKKHNGDKLKRLLAGDISDYHGDASAADMACASMLSFWFWLDADAIAGVMTASDLYREKWDSKRGKRTYLEYTIRKALAGKEHYYGKPQRLPSRAVIAADSSAAQVGV